MKKKRWLPIIIVLLLLILLVPIPSGTYKDGGTKEYTSLTYKIVKWNRLVDLGSVYSATKVYLFPDNFKSIDVLWEYESPSAERSFIATIVEWNETSVVVQPTRESAVFECSDRISFGTSGLAPIDAKVGSVVEIVYTGEVMETWPLQIDVKSWALSSDFRDKEYTDVWIDKQAVEPWEGSLFDEMIITEIYSNCFFATAVGSMPLQVKLNGELADEWCVGDVVAVTYTNVYYDRANNRVECDFSLVEKRMWEENLEVAYKPVIYLYPPEETEVSVILDYAGSLTCTYPAYKDGWTVTASPDGTLRDAGGQTYNYLYWEGKSRVSYDFSKGFCVRGEDTAAFLEDALETLGLTRREANEFIVFWLPQMEQNPYNIISFQTDCYTESAKLFVDPKPDTLIRVFMAWKPSGEYVQLEKQELAAPERNGFTVVEWGGTKIK